MCLSLTQRLIAFKSLTLNLTALTLQWCFVTRKIADSNAESLIRTEQQLPTNIEYRWGVLLTLSLLILTGLYYLVVDYRPVSAVAKRCENTRGHVGRRMFRVIHHYYLFSSFYSFSYYWYSNTIWIPMWHQESNV